MPVIDWKEYLDPSSQCEIRYSYLHSPHDDQQFDCDVVNIRLPAGFIVDVGWEDVDSMYILTLSRFAFDNILMQVEETNVDEVIRQVAEWVRIYSETPAV